MSGPKTRTTIDSLDPLSTSLTRSLRYVWTVR